MTYFHAAILQPDDTAGDIEFGFSGTASGASAIALRLANSLKQDACVVEVTSKGPIIRERVRYKNEIALTEKPIPSHDEPQYLSSVKVGSPALDSFIRHHTARGYTVSLTRCLFEAGHDAPDFVNAVARRR